VKFEIGTSPRWRNSKRDCAWQPQESFPQEKLARAGTSRAKNRRGIERNSREVRFSFVIIQDWQLRVLAFATLERENGTQLP
jgi:hypothetical protein